MAFGRYFTNQGPPIGIPPNGYRIPDVTIDTIKHEAYQYISGSWVLQPNFFGVGSQGPQGPQGPVGSQGATGAPGAQGSKGDIGLQGIKGDKGDIGPQGPAGTGSTPAIVVPATQDWQGLQNAINGSVGKAIFLYGTYNIDRMLDYKLNPGFTLFGNKASINTTNSATYPVFGRSNKPTTKAEAELLAGTMGCRIQDLSINLQGSQTGIELNSVSAPTLEKIFISGGSSHYVFDYCMKGDIRGCQSNGAVTAFKAGIAAGDQEMSSNAIRFTQCEAHSCSNIGFDIQKAYEAQLNQCVVEGNNTCLYAIHFDGSNKNTGYDFSVNTFHFEQIGGCTAVVKLDLNQNTVVLDNITAHYQGLLVDASSAGNGTVWMPRCNWAVGDANGKFFKSANTTWIFQYSNFFQTWNLQQKFVTPAPQHYTGSSGYNQWVSVDVPR